MKGVMSRPLLTSTTFTAHQHCQHAGWCYSVIVITQMHSRCNLRCSPHLRSDSVCLRCAGALSLLCSHCVQQTETSLAVLAIIAVFAVSIEALGRCDGIKFYCSIAVCMFLCNFCHCGNCYHEKRDGKCQLYFNYIHLMPADRWS